MKPLFKSVFRSSYRFLQGIIVKNYFLPFFFSKARIQEASRNHAKSASLPEWQQSKRHAGSVGRIWFHAASVGELETLWPLILSCAEGKNELVLTILSESADRALEGLKTTLLEMQSKILFCGYSPWEGEWPEALKRLKPDLFVTAKYEAWPDLWISLKEQGIPLSIVSVRARKSLRIAQWFCNALGEGVPSLILFPCLQSEVNDLRNLFPEAVLEVAGEPRWDRVYSRSRKGNARARELIQVYQQARRPWGVIGSAWLEDLKFLGQALEKTAGTLWVVPHRVEAESIQEIEELLISHGLKPLRTSEASGFQERENSLRPQCVLVNEMGFLSELYSVADWAFVGGGFGAGIHSTIEPAIHGIPIAVGPKGTEKFSEVVELSQSGQLTILQNEKALSAWIEHLNLSPIEKKSVWMADAKSRLGATQKILATIEKFESAW